MELNGGKKINGVYFEPIASASDFYDFIENNKNELGFNSDAFHDVMVGRHGMFNEGSLSSRYDQEHLKDVIENTKPYYKGEFWDKCRPYYPAILLFMEEFELETIRFEADW